VTVRISPDPLPGSTEKSVHVIGAPAQIGKAMARIIKQIHSNPPKAGTTYTPYAPEQHPGRSTVGDDQGKRDRAASHAAAQAAGVSASPSDRSPSSTTSSAPAPTGYPYPPHPHYPHYPHYPDPHNPYGYPPTAGGYPPAGAAGADGSAPPNPYGYPPNPYAPPHAPWNPYGGAEGYPPYGYPPYGYHYPPPAAVHAARPSPENMTKQDVAIPTVSAGAVIGMFILYFSFLHAHCGI
jgi:hypothetical protein